jgi:translation elongation factor EF-G
MIASVPVERVQGIANAIDKSTAGTAEPSKEFERLVARIKPVKSRPM